MTIFPGLYFDAEKKLFYDGQKGLYLEFNDITGDYEPLVDPEPESSSSLSDTSEDNAAIQNEPPSREPRELSDGEVSSPSPPPPVKKKKPKKRNETEQNYRKEKKRRKKELTIPCIRLVVHATSEQSQTVQVGTLFIVTCKGGSIGREGNHDVLLDDIACSKFHGQIEFDEDTLKYYLKDAGSQNGTFVDGVRLSAAKRESRPREIGHGTLIRIGSTQLICHVHPGKIIECFQCKR